MERLLVLRLEAVDCQAEALLNGVPLARVDPARPARTLPVHEFTLAGANELELVVHPPPPGAPEVTAPQIGDGKAWAGVRLLLPRVGQIAHPSNARTLAQIDWAVPEGELYEAPVHIAQKVELKIAFPRWRWLDVPMVDDAVAARPQAIQLLQRLAVGLARGDPDPFLKAARLRFEELALAYQRNLADEAGRWRTLVQALRAAGPFKPELASLPGLQLRKVAGGRLLECLAADGQPALRGAGTDGVLRQWPLRVAMIEGGLHVLR
jgi:hypothetical protein